MKRIIIVLAVTVAITMGVISVKAAEKNNSGEQIFKTKCSACHSYEIPLNMKKDRKGWEETVKLMQGKRPNFISNQDAQKIVNFLVAHSEKKEK